ncbi:MAG: fused MFS/spermidine synthase, partial [Thermoanaerobaculia bacterium]
LLGGSTYTFGLILAVALLGIGLGGAAFARFGEGRPATFAGLAATCGLEAACMALPYALGDHVALFAAFERSLGGLGFPGSVLSWIEVAGLVVLPAACVAGFQFPLLVALLGRGREGVGRDVGLAYAWNTLGGICGCLAGGFGLLPLLSATGAWVAAVLLLAALSAGALVLSFRFEGRLRPMALPLAALLASFFLLRSEGPTAAWRHSPIGAGRVHLESASPNVVRAWQRDQRRSLEWEADGLESSVALLKTSAGLAFIINGKVDGSSRGDAETQVMSGLVGAALHPEVRQALVVGLGTGSTAGWLAAVPSVGRVDVVELEAAVLRVARDCAPVNREALGNSKVRVLIGDARDFLLTTRERYDLIFSEPSNPYRAGISSLFTQEFYGAARSRLAAGGIFVQWLQAYEVNSQTVRTIYATLASVFQSVETFSTKKDDLLLVASEQPIRYPVGQLRRRLGEEPFASAMHDAWRAQNLEGFLSHYVARGSLARAIARQEAGRINSDDRNPVEFGFARSLGQPSLFQSDELRELARARGEDRPALDGGEVDWAVVASQRLSGLTAEGVGFEAPPNSSPEDVRRIAAHASFLAGNLGQVRGDYLAGPWEPAGPLELAMLGEALADGGDRQALAYAERLREQEPAEADAIAARYLWSQGKWAECYQATASAFERYRQDPWPLGIVMQRLLAVAADLPSRDARLALPVYRLLTPAFAVALLDEARILARLAVARHLGPERVAEALEALEPHFPWRRDLLEERARVYEQVGNPRAELARRELEAFLRHDPTPFSKGLEAAPSP